MVNGKTLSGTWFMRISEPREGRPGSAGFDIHSDRLFDVAGEPGARLALLMDIMAQNNDKREPVADTVKRGKAWNINV